MSNRISVVGTRRRCTDNGSGASSFPCRPRRNTQRRTLFEEDTAVSREEQKLVQRALYASLRDCETQRRWVYVDRHGEVIDFYQPPARISKRRRKFCLIPRFTSNSSTSQESSNDHSNSNSAPVERVEKVDTGLVKSENGAGSATGIEVRRCAKRKFAEGFGSETTEQSRLFEDKSDKQRAQAAAAAAPRPAPARNFAFKLPVRELLKKALSAETSSGKRRNGTRQVRIETREEFLRGFGVAHILSDNFGQCMDGKRGSASSCGQSSASRVGSSACERCVRTAKQRKLECFVDRLRSAALIAAGTPCECSARRDSLHSSNSSAHRVVVIRESRVLVEADVC